jgi:hypothetical protein
MERVASGRRRVADELGDTSADSYAQTRPVGTFSETPIDGFYSAFSEEAAEYLGPTAMARGDRVRIPGTDRLVQLTGVLGSREGGVFTGRWIHMDPRDVPPVLEYVDTLYQRARSSSTSREETIRLVAEMHWWMAHAMPYRRGSAAVTDASLRALLHSRGIEVGRWRPGISPDIRAFHRDLQSFVAEYPSLFE